MNEMSEMNQKIRQAELRRLVRIIGLKYARAQYKANNTNDQFAIYHFAQALAYEDSIEAIKKEFHEEMAGEDWE